MVKRTGARTKILIPFLGNMQDEIEKEGGVLVKYSKNI